LRQCRDRGQVRQPPRTVSAGIGFAGVALAFGLTVLTMAYAVGHGSGAHFNPAVTIGLAVARRFEWKDAAAYVGTQVVAGLVAGGLLVLIAKGQPGFVATGNMAANGYGAHSPGGYSLVAVLITEILLTGFFLYVILGATDTRAPEGFAPIAVGLSLTLIHLISIPIDNTSVNPARSTGVAFFNGNGAPGQLWLFWLAPILVRPLPVRLTPSLPASTVRTVRSPATPRPPERAPHQQADIHGQPRTSMGTAAGLQLELPTGGTSPSSRCSWFSPMHLKISPSTDEAWVAAGGLSKQ
jgi:aquaporin Z